MKLAGVGRAAMLTMLVYSPTTALAQANSAALTRDVDDDGGASAATDGDIVVTAQRRSELLERTPVSVSAFNPVALTQRGISTESDLQTSVAGLGIRTALDPNEFSYSLRGQTVEFASSSEPAVLPYINEVPAPSNAASSFYDLDSIQVLKGPQGTLFGKNVTGGAVLISTAQPTDEFGGYVQLRAGNYDRVEVQGALNIPLVGDAVLLRIASNYERRDGFTRNLFDGSREGGFRRQSYRATLALKPTEQITNTLVVDYSRYRGGGTPAVIYETYAPGSTNNGIPLAGSSTSVLFSPGLDAAIGVPGAWQAYLNAHPGADPAGLLAFTATQKARGPYVIDQDVKTINPSHGIVVSDTLAWELSDGLKLKNIAAFSRFKSRQVHDQDGSPFYIVVTDQTRINEQFTDEFQLVGEALDSKLKYVAGAFFAKQKRFFDNSASYFDLSPIIPMAGAHYLVNLKNQDFALYGEATYSLDTLVAGLSVTGGVRYTWSKVELEQLPGSALRDIPGLPNEERQHANKLSWHVGVQEQLSNELMLYAASRRSFRSGGFAVYSAPLPETAQTGGNKFNPEIATDIEIGAKFRGDVAGRPVRFSIAGYNQWIDGLQRSAYVNTPPIIAVYTANLPNTKIKGIEIETQIGLADWLDVGGNFAYTDAKFSKTPLVLFGSSNVYGPYPDSSKYSGSAYVQVSAPLSQSLGTLRIRGDLFAQSKFYFGSLDSSTIPGTEIPGYSITNLRISLDDVMHKAVSIAAVAKNVFDKTYYTGGSASGGVVGYNIAVPGDRRTVYLEARLSF